MRGGTWIAGLVFFGLLFGGCVSQGKYLDLEKRYVERGEALARANALMDEYNEKVNTLSVDLRAKECLLKKREEELALTSSVQAKVSEQWKTKLKTYVDQLEGQFKSTEGVTFDKKRGALVLEGSVFFDSGKANIKHAAKKTLLKIARSLKDLRGSIQIMGHSDSEPVRKSAKMWPHGNIQLSGARAMNVLLYLEKSGGVPGKRMSFAGCGPHQPRVPNNSKANKKLNRRVEILVNELME
ncbi:MAG: OmpA/MotB family protein [Planctomycetota bacterium]